MARIGSGLVWMLALGLAARAQDAGAILDGVFRHTLSRTMRYEGVLRVWEPGGKTSEKRWWFERAGAPGEGKITIRFTYPPEVKGVGLLILCRPGVESDQWLYTPATGRTRRISSGARGNRFFSTDLTFADFEEGHIRNFDLRLMGSEPQGGEEAWTIEGTPRWRAPYEKKVFWVSKSRPILLRTDVYGDGKPVRRIRQQEWRMVQGVWSAGEVEITDLVRGTRTVLSITQLQYDVALPAARFTRQALEDPQG